MLEDGGRVEERSCVSFLLLLGGSGAASRAGGLAAAVAGPVMIGRERLSSSWLARCCGASWWWPERGGCGALGESSQVCLKAGAPGPEPYGEGILVQVRWPSSGGALTDGQLQEVSPVTHDGVDHSVVCSLLGVSTLPPDVEVVQD